MRDYETLYIINPTLEEDEIKNVVEKFKTLIQKNGGEVTDINEWGKRRLAYTVKNMNEGYYVLMQFKAEPAVVQDLERVFKITDEVIRYLITKQE
ncbi:MAG TPA: 30S ribosomal protein S6 [Thermoanaerobacterales bacterium]|nr:30S ribosomal protein S6 [Thermoanaerobacterales bacterium]